MSARCGQLALLLAAALLAVSCAMGPNYHRPKTSVPAAFRFDEHPPADSFADQGWWQIYQDPVLDDLLKEALANNLDVRIAAARIEEARAVLGATRMQLLPQLSVSADAQRGRVPFFQVPAGTPPISNVFSVDGNLSYEIDFWGKYRRMAEASRAQLLSSQYARDDVAAGLVAGVATAYFTLQTLDEQLAITRRTVDTRRKFVQLTQAQHERGTVSGLDVATAQAQLAIAEANIPDLQRQIGQAEDQLSVLLGRNPDAVLRSADGELRRAAETASSPVPPAGLPSSLLERRPDIREAEENLVAANAQIGVARANLFPSISLTAAAGAASTALGDIAHSTSRTWSLAGGLLQPLLNPQRSWYQVQLADAQKREAVLRYQKSLQSAFQEVSDALIAREKFAEFQVAQQAQVDAQRKANTIALARYRVGYVSYFNVIDADRDLFNAELALSSAHLSNLLAMVQLYRALGGGWQAAPGQPDSPPPAQ